MVSGYQFHCLGSISVQMYTNANEDPGVRLTLLLSYILCDTNWYTKEQTNVKKMSNTKDREKTHCYVVVNEIFQKEKIHLYLLNGLRR